MTWIVTVQEGTHEVDNATYYCDEEPQWVAQSVTGSRTHTTVLKFVPKNGSAPRVGHVNSVPRERVVAITEEAPAALDS